MKVVIDIPESYYEACKQWKEGHVAQVAEMIVADGKPYDERPSGQWKWIGSMCTDNLNFICNQCGRTVKDRENYCPKCGANMQERYNAQD